MSAFDFSKMSEHLEPTTFGLETIPRVAEQEASEQIAEVANQEATEVGEIHKMRIIKEMPYRSRRGKQWAVPRSSQPTQDTDQLSPPNSKAPIDTSEDKMEGVESSTQDHGFGKLIGPTLRVNMEGCSVDQDGRESEVDPDEANFAEMGIYTDEKRKSERDGIFQGISCNKTSSL